MTTNLELIKSMQSFVAGGNAPTAMARVYVDERPAIAWYTTIPIERINLAAGECVMLGLRGEITELPDTDIHVLGFI